jgi:hypothetical protein
MVVVVHTLIGVAVNRPKGMNYIQGLIFYCKNAKEI